MIPRVICAVILIGAPAAADDLADREKLVGKWRDDAGREWVLEKADESLRVTQRENGKTLIDLECNTMGRPCEIDGSNRTVSMYYYGPRLIQTETKGSQVIKRRFLAVDEGSSLELEVMPIVPPGETRVLRLKRQ